MPNQDDLGVYTRRTGESAKAFAAFCEYRDLGPERSISKVAQKLHKSVTILGRWSGKFGWVQRSAAYDVDLGEQERKAKEYALGVEAEKWAKRRLEVAEQDWQEAQALGERIRQMQAFPLQTVERKETEESKDGKTIIIKITVIKPAGWTYREVINGQALVMRMRRLCVGLATGNTTTTVQGTGEGGAIAVENLEEIRRKRWAEALPAIVGMLREEGRLSAETSGEDSDGAAPRE